jgi:hypothetical protein
MLDLALGHSTANKDYRSEQFVKVTITNKIKISALSNVKNVCKYLKKKYCFFQGKMVKRSKFKSSKL